MKPAPLPSLLSLYQQQLAAHGWVADAAQAAAVVRLGNLAHALAASDTATPPKGVYFYGPVGRGKSMLMDLFYEAVTVPKRRVHFHAFMQEVHARMHATKVKPGQDLMQLVAAQVAEEAMLLCFDEFYVTNIADAMLLGRLFAAMFAQGIVVVATSNWPMEELFQGGINRDRFVPFIRLMEKHLESLAIGEGRDYRVRPKGLPELYVLEDVDLPAAPQLEALFAHFGNGMAPVLPPQFHAKRQQGRACWFSFAGLCEQNYDAGDYMALVKVCDTLVLEGVPVLGPADANAALRLVALVDILYEHKKRLVVGAAAAPQVLCVAGDAAEAFRRTASRMMQLADPSWTGGVVKKAKAVRKVAPKTGKPAKPHTRKSKLARSRTKKGA